MRKLPILPFVALVLCGEAALAVQPLRFVAAGFETNDPQRDCAVDATTEAVLAERLRATGVNAICVPPFMVGPFEVCAGVSSQCANGCFVPVGPTSSATVDAIAGRIELADLGGQVTARIRSPVQPECTAGFGFSALSMTLDYVSLNDGLDGVLLAGLAAPPDVRTSGPAPISGCAGLGDDIEQIGNVLRGRILDAYRDATLARIGEPLDAAVCPIERP